MKNIIKRLLINRKYIINQANSITGCVLAAFGTLDMIVSFSDYLSEEMKLVRRILFAGLIIIVIWFIALLVMSVSTLRKRRIEILDVGNNHHVYVQYGDVFSSEEVVNSSQRRNIVVPVNRCFDTIVDDNIISSTTLHGKALKMVYRDTQFNESTLSDYIQNNLECEQKIESKLLSQDEKRAGNLKRYPVGSVAEVKVSNTRFFFFLGLSTFNYDLKAETKETEYYVSLMKLLEYCNARSQGFPVVMPLIGTGLSRTNYSERDILEFLISFLKMNKKLIDCDIHIVISNNRMDSISITEL